MADACILVVDDEPEIRALLRQALEMAGFRVVETTGKDAALRLLDDHPIDLVTLDLKLEHESGLEAALEIRAKRNIPIVMITGRSGPLDRVIGLEHGADDYITKPFHLREVVLRLRNVLKRYAKPPRQPAISGPRYAFDGYVLDMEKRDLRTIGGDSIDLTDLEFRLVLLFAQNPARVLSRDDMSQALNGRDWSPLDRAIDGHIARLRRKLEAPSDEPRLIKSVRGVGYVFSAAVRTI